MGVLAMKKIYVVLVLAILPFNGIALGQDDTGPLFKEIAKMRKVKEKPIISEEQMKTLYDYVINNDDVSIEEIDRENKGTPY